MNEGASQTHNCTMQKVSRYSKTPKLEPGMYRNLSLFGNFSGANVAELKLPLIIIHLSKLFITKNGYNCTLQVT
jgi:hypothetical protein